MSQTKLFEGAPRPAPASQRTLQPIASTAAHARVHAGACPDRRLRHDALRSAEVDAQIRTRLQADRS
jgi:hypothetical protein